MEKLKQLVTFLEGKKTYLISVLTVVDGLYQYYIQHGSNWQTFLVYLLFGGGLAALRAAVAKTGR